MALLKPTTSLSPIKAITEKKKKTYNKNLYRIQARLSTGFLPLIRLAWRVNRHKVKNSPDFKSMMG